VQGVSGEIPNCISFQQNFEGGSCLTIVSMIRGLHPADKQQFFMLHRRLSGFDILIAVTMKIAVILDMMPYTSNLCSEYKVEAVYYSETITVNQTTGWLAYPRRQEFSLVYFFDFILNVLL
jgi:hypothetical protein